MISQYNTVGLPEGPRNIMFVIGKSIRLEGFNVANYFDLCPNFTETCPDGYAKARSRGKKPSSRASKTRRTAFLKFFTGENFGKMLVKLS